MQNIQLLAPWASVLVAIVAALLVWGQWRERQLRKDDVLKWANEVIRALQTLYLTCYLGERTFEPEAIAKALRQAAVDTSVLVEQGRLFFRNAPDPTHGRDKFPAYRGYRPELLDPIVVAHQIACQWQGADAAARQRMTLVAEDAVKQFVSYAQQEVGRSKTASREAARGGRGDNLEAMMVALDSKRVEALAEREATSP